MRGHHFTIRRRSEQPARGQAFRRSGDHAGDGHHGIEATEALLGQGDGRPEAHRVSGVSLVGHHLSVRGTTFGPGAHGLGHD